MLTSSNGRLTRLSQRLSRRNSATAKWLQIGSFSRECQNLPNPCAPVRLRPGALSISAMSACLQRCSATWRLRVTRGAADLEPRNPVTLSRRLSRAARPRQQIGAKRRLREAQDSEDREHAGPRRRRASRHHLRWRRLSRVSPPRLPPRDPRTRLTLNRSAGPAVLRGRSMPSSIGSSPTLNSSAGLTRQIRHISVISSTSLRDMATPLRAPQLQRSGSRAPAVAARRCAG